MKRLKHNFKKGMAFVLSLAMVAGLVPAMSGGANKVQAASGSGTEPSVSAYATKEQLMTAFTPDSEGNATNTNIGKLVFGKNSSGNPQEWYILGKDEGVSGDNTIIFAASPIATGQVFEDDYSNKKPFDSSFGVYASNHSSEVYPNHYGASDLRVVLKSMADDSNETYFTTAEQNLMNATTVTTNDTNNGVDYTGVNYTTTDKLYALQGKYGDNDKLWAGTNDSTVLAMSSYWSSGAWFWLRSPYASHDVLLAGPGNYVGVNAVTLKSAVQPASNLNLSSVLFASAVTAASSDTAEPGTIADGTAMTLRLDGTGKNIGTVTYNTTTGDIKATKGSTSQTVALVVQGKDGTNDWYYSKKIGAAETVNASVIKSSVGLSSDIDLSACKIWLETTDSTENLTYAVGAIEAINITSVEITGIDTPVSNTALDTEAACATTGVSSNTPQITWTPSDSTAGYNTSYTASITLTGYEFIDSTTATVSGNTATSVTKNADGTLTVTYAFPATAKDKLTSITPPQAITVANGTAYSAMNLPATVGIVTEGNTVTSAPVTWNTTTPASGSYDPAVLTEQTVTLNGTVACPDSIDANRVSLTTTITITISAAYEILDGANSNWEQSSDGSLSIRGSGALSKFVGVKVDGTLVDAKNYTVKEGSTIVTLKADYLNTLSVGTHTFEILWTDGSASTTFTIKANTSDDSNNNQNDNNNSDSSDDKPSSGTDKKDDVTKTGDNTPIVWLFILSILSGTGLIITVKKRRENLNS